MVHGIGRSHNLQEAPLDRPHLDEDMLPIGVLAGVDKFGHQLVVPTSPHSEVLQAAVGGVVEQGLVVGAHIYMHRQALKAATPTVK